MLKPRFLLLSAIVLAAAAWRLMPFAQNWPNFTPVGAACLLAGAYAARRTQAYAASLGILLISDIILNSTTYATYGLSSLAWQIPTYLGWGLVVAMGSWGLRRPNALKVGLSAVGAAVVFYLVTNCVFLSWGHEYPLTWAGQAESYRQALPFFRNMLAANLIFAPVFFGGFEAARRSFPALDDAESKPAPAAI